MPAPFTDYQPIDGHMDAYEFTTPDGKKRTLIGSAATQMKKTIDSTKQLTKPSMGIGGIWGSPAPPSLTDTVIPVARAVKDASGWHDPAEFGKPKTQEVPGTVPGTPATPATVPGTVPGTTKEPGTVQTGVSQEAQLPQGQPMADPGITMPRYASVKGGVLDTTTGIVRSAGTPGASKAQIEKEKQAQAETLKTMNQRADEARDREIEKANIMAENAEATQMFLEQERSKAETRAFHEEIRNQEIADRVASERADLDKQMADWRSSKVDPDRFFKGEKGGTNKMLAVISLISGAFAQFGQGLMGNAGASNPGVALLGRKIDEDVREQEREINVKKESKDNALAQLSRSLGDMQQAKIALKAIQTDVAAAKMAELANSTKSPLIRNQLEATKAELLVRKEALAGEFTRLGELKLRAMRGSGPSVRAATLDELKAVSGIRSTDAGTEKTGVEAFSAAQKAAAAMNGGAPADLPESGRQLLAARAGLSAMEEQLAGDATAGGKPWTPEGQNMAAAAARRAMDSIGGAGTYKETALSGEEKARSDRFNNSRQALIAIGTQLTGAGAPSEGEAIRSAAGSAQNEEQLLNIIKSNKQILSGKLKAYGVNTPKVDIKPE